MCGIAGIRPIRPPGRGGRGAPEAHARRPAPSRPRRRGPAGSTARSGWRIGAWRSSTSPAAQQPMANEDGTRLDRLQRRDLQPRRPSGRASKRRGHRYRTRSDTETILHLYEEEGDALRRASARACSPSRSGIAPRERLLLARDRLGIKPLYYALTDDELLFGSEIKAILAASPGAPAFNEDAIPEFLATRFVAGEETFFQGIRKLLPGHTLTWSRAEGSAAPPLLAPAGRHRRAAGRPREERRAELRGRLEAAVRSHLMSDVPLGVFLSGGLDSSALAALMAPMATRADPHLRGRLRRARSQRARLRAPRRRGDRARSIARSSSRREEFFDALPRLDLARGRADRVPVERPAPLRVAAGPRAREGRAHRRRRRRAVPRLQPVPRHALERAARPAVLGGWCPARYGAARPAAVDTLPARSSRRYAERSFLALEPGHRDLFLENFAVFSGARAAAAARSTARC